MAAESVSSKWCLTSILLILSIAIGNLNHEQNTSLTSTALSEYGHQVVEYFLVLGLKEMPLYFGVPFHT